MRFLHFLGERRPESLTDQANYREADPRNRNASPSGQKVPKGVAGEALGGRKKK